MKQNEFTLNIDADILCRMSSGVQLHGEYNLRSKSLKLVGTVCFVDLDVLLIQVLIETRCTYAISGQVKTFYKPPIMTI